MAALFLAQLGNSSGQDLLTLKTFANKHPDIGQGAKGLAKLRDSRMLCQVVLSESARWEDYLVSGAILELAQADTTILGTASLFHLLMTANPKTQEQAQEALAKRLSLPDSGKLRELKIKMWAAKEAGPGQRLAQGA